MGKHTYRFAPTSGGYLATLGAVNRNRPPKSRWPAKKYLGRLLSASLSLSLSRARSLSSSHCFGHRHHRAFTVFLPTFSIGSGGYLTTSQLRYKDYRPPAVAGTLWYRTAAFLAPPVQHTRPASQITLTYLLHHRKGSRSVPILTHTRARNTHYSPSWALPLLLYSAYHQHRFPEFKRFQHACQSVSPPPARTQYKLSRGRDRTELPHRRLIRLKDTQSTQYSFSPTACRSVF